MGKKHYRSATVYSSRLGHLLRERIHFDGDRIMLAFTDRWLEQLGERLMIATHRIYDRKTFGCVALREVVRLLLQLPPKPMLNRQPAMALMKRPLESKLIN